MEWTIEQRRDAAFRGPLGGGFAMADTRVIERDGWYQVITPSTKSSVLNEVVVSRVDRDRIDEVIDRVIAEYRAHGLPVKWCVGPWTEPADFGDRLTERGFKHWDVRGMTAFSSMRLEAPQGVCIEEVGEENLDAYLDTFMKGWSMAKELAEPMRAQHLAAFRREPRKVHCFLASIDGAAAGTTGVILRDHFAYFVGAQILEHARGRGLYRALIERRMELLRSRGIELAVTHAREATSAPMLEHLGFETVFRSKCYVLDR